MRHILLGIVLVGYMILSIPYQIFLLILKLIDGGLSQYLAFRFLQNLSNKIFAVAGTRLHIEGKENLNHENYLIVANHYSLLDTPLVLKLSKHALGFFGKKELLYVPFLNIWLYLSGGYFLDRKSIRKGYKTIMKGIGRLSNGENMAIFPQGTRVKDGNFLPFKKGSFKLATASNSKIIPICIYGSENIYEANGKKIKPADVYVHVFEAIETEGMTKEEQKEISKKVENLIYSKYMEYKNNTI